MSDRKNKKKHKEKNKKETKELEIHDNALLTNLLFHATGN